MCHDQIVTRLTRLVTEILLCPWIISNKPCTNRRNKMHPAHQVAGPTSSTILTTFTTITSNHHPLLFHSNPLRPSALSLANPTRPNPR